MTDSGGTSEVENPLNGSREVETSQDVIWLLTKTTDWRTCPHVLRGGHLCTYALRE